MSGCYKGSSGRIKIVAPHVTWSHCCINRQSLASKPLPDSLKEVLNKSVKVVNCIKANSTNTRLFRSLCGDMGSLHTTLLLHTESKIIQETRITLLGNARIRLGWVKAHIGIKDNETADALAKVATKDGTPANLQFPKRHLKNQLLQLSLRVGKLSGIIVRLADRFTALYCKHQTNSCTGPENASNSPLAMALPQLPKEIWSPFNRLLRLFWEIVNALHYAKRCPLTLSYHLKEPSPQSIVHWWKSALSSKLSRRNIGRLIKFLATNEDLIKSQNTTPSHAPT
ncbi:hypothetical protein AVEN_69951-1 [Araneus ventricosus]|uniref:Uncharacterized protein n=1 Tax=Araneus ventricosus TaxID=182803 RepID=A0A4Y2LVE0_ARAVE|nr:hypothetical protein AVEN_69951-1 [Araneus ventricosus]